MLKTKIAVDMAMTVTLMLCMAYMLTGDLAHEIIGTVIIVLWAVHHILNRRWYSFRKRRPPGGIRPDTVVNLLLLLTMIGLVVSSVILSSFVFGFLNLDRGMGFARVLHMVTSYWCFVLSAVHLGLHWSRVTRVLSGNRRLPSSRVRSSLIHAAVLVLSAIGLYAFVRQQLALYMFGRVLFVFFDFEQSALSFFFEYLCMMVLFGAAAYYPSVFLKKRRVKEAAE